MENPLLPDLTVRELELFLLAARTQSLREVARQAGLLPAHVSKIIQRLERKIGHPLFRRSAKGILLTPEGLALVDPAARIRELSEGVIRSSRRTSADERLWTIASISFLTTYLLAPHVAEWRARSAGSRFRLIEFTHNDLVGHGLKGAFEMAVHIEELEWTHAWETFLLGSLHWKLYARRGHPLGTRSTQREALKFPFVVPTDWGQHGYVAGDDHCPVSVRNRPSGDEAATAETALELCRRSDQLTFIPEVLAARWVGSGDVQEVRVVDWEPVRKEIFLSVKADLVPQRLVDLISRSAGLTRNRRSRRA